MGDEQDYNREIGILDLKINYNIKLLDLAIEDENEERIHRLKSNIEQHKKEKEDLLRKR